MKNRLAWMVVGVALVIGVTAACSDSDEGSGSTTTTNRGFEVQTPEGQVSLSLSGNLPPNWPDDFPVPEGAEPAGSGSLGGENQTGFVGVYSSAQSAEDVYTFYRDNADLEIDNASSIGSGSTYLGTVQFSGQWSGSVVVLPYTGGESLIVVLLSQSSPGTTIVSGTGTVVPATVSSTTVS